MRVSAVVCLPAPPPLVTSLHEPDAPSPWSLDHLVTWGFQYGDSSDGVRRLLNWLFRPSDSAAQPQSFRNVNPARWSPGLQDQLESFGLGQALFCCERRPEVQRAFMKEQHDGVCLMWALCQLQKVRILTKVRRGDVSARTIDKPKSPITFTLDQLCERRVSVMPTIWTGWRLTSYIQCKHK